MSDSCWFSIAVKNEDIEEFKKIFIPLKNYPADEEYEDEHYTEFIFYEANYGFYTEIEDLQTKDINFRGRHGNGGDFGSMRFAQYNNMFDEINTDYDGNISISANNATGKITVDKLIAAEEFAKLDQKVIEYFKSNGIKSIW